MNSAEIIRTCRERAGMTRRQLANAIGTTPDHVWKWETQGVNPRVDYLIAAVQATGFEIIIKEKSTAYYSSDKTRRKRVYG